MLLLSAALLAVGLVLPPLALANAPAATKVQYIRFKDEYCFTPLVRWAAMALCRDALSLGAACVRHFRDYILYIHHFQN